MRDGFSLEIRKRMFMQTQQQQQQQQESTTEKSTTYMMTEAERMIYIRNSADIASERSQ